MKWTTTLVTGIALFAANAVDAGEPLSIDEPYDTGWAFYADNDLFAATGTDRDYTGGFSLTLSGRRARESWFSIDGWRAAVDHLFGADRLYEDRALSRHSMETGITVFTPANLNDPAAQVGDRPYASIIFLSNTSAEVVPSRNVAYLSTLTVGVLGLPAVGNTQHSLHASFGDNEPVGWNKQISHGGEPTFRYSFARVQHVWSGAFGRGRGEMTVTTRGSVGYLTEGSYGIAARFGNIRTPWWSYNPQIAEYAEKSVPVISAEGGGAERYVWLGVNLHARLYNAFLQGQFRDSPVRFSYDELRPIVLEGWLGYTWATASGWRYSYALRGQTSEIRDGPGDRHDLWAGIVISHAM
jgi:hypothetical protein